jgi:hypothetical protein
VLADCPELRGLTTHATAFLLVGALGVVALILGAVRPRLGVVLYLLGFMPLSVLVSAHWANLELEAHRVPTVYDRAGQFVRPFIGAETALLLVVGPDVAGLFQTRFTIDDPATRIDALPEGEPLDPASLTPETMWVLYIGQHPHPGQVPVADTEGQGYFLVRLRR